jgi:voltage-gated potassium channel
MIKYAVSYSFPDQVKLRRVLKMYGLVNINFMHIFRSLYAKHDVSLSVITLIIFIVTLLIMIMQFEMRNENILSLQEGVYFLVATMTTVGYGDYFPLGQKGKLSAISSIALGVVFEGMFLIAW